MPNAIDAKVPMDSSFAELPDHILSSCLRLTTFAAKLRCQQVCTSWRSLLNRSAASGDACEASTSSSWGRSLMLYVSAPTEALARTRVVDLGYKQATMDLITTAGPLSVHNEACLHWVAQRAMDFPYVRIQIREVLPAQLLAQLATALKAAAALAPSGWQLQLDADFDITDPQIGCQQLAGVLKYWKAGTAYIQQLSCLTHLTRLSCSANSELGSLDGLQQLSLLQTLKLSRPSAVLRDVHSFKFVQSLRLQRIEGEVCNIETYTQLTHLRISIQSEDTVKEILLPFSDGVKLRRLDIWGPSHEHTFHLRNLTLATRLKDIYLCSSSPQNFEQAKLSALPFLTQLRVARPNCAWIQTLTLCSSLQSLYVFDYEQPTLPSSFSLLTHLKTLSINGCSFAQFPDCLMHLSHLESLSVSCDKPGLHLSDSILCLAKWPNLKYLDISDRSQRVFPVESQLLLGQLQKQLRDCSSSCKFIFSHA